MFLERCGTLDDDSRGGLKQKQESGINLRKTCLRFPKVRFIQGNGRGLRVRIYLAGESNVISRGVKP